MANFSMTTFWHGVKQQLFARHTLEDYTEHSAAHPTAITTRNVHRLSIRRSFFDCLVFDVDHDGTLVLLTPDGAQLVPLHDDQLLATIISHNARHTDACNVEALRLATDGDIVVARYGVGAYGLNTALYVGPLGGPTQSIPTAKPTTTTFDTSGRYLAVGTSSGSLILHDRLRAQPERYTHSAGIVCSAFSADGTMLAVGCNDGSIYIHRVPTLDSPTRLATKTTTIDHLTISPDGQYVLFSSGAVLQWWNLARGEVIAQVAHDFDISALAFSDDGALLAVGDVSGRVHLWDALRGTDVLAATGQQAAINGLRFAADQTCLLVSDSDGLLHEWAIGPLPA